MTGTATSSEVPEATSPRPAIERPVAALQSEGTTGEVTEVTAALKDDGLTDVDSASSTSRSYSTEKEEGEIAGGENEDNLASGPPLPTEPFPSVSSGPPLPDEPVPQADDGWDCQWDPVTQAWFFYNRFTGKTQWENPRAPLSSAADPAVAVSNPRSPSATPSASTTWAATSYSTDNIVGGYNPAIHGDYDPNAWYAQKCTQLDEPHVVPEIPSMEDEPYAATAGFNRFTGHFQQPDAGPGRHADEAKSTRQLNAYFDVDAVTSMDDGRSLKAERSNKRISKSELKAFKEKRKARKEEKRRAWLRD